MEWVFWIALGLFGSFGIVFAWSLLRISALADERAMRVNEEPSLSKGISEG
jgi:hypothetical protein